MTVFTYEDLENENVNMLVPYYLMSCYLYYILDVNVFSDDDFNKLCAKLLKEINNITHRHKYLIDTESLKASTGYDISYPNIVKKASTLWYAEYLKYIKTYK